MPGEHSEQPTERQGQEDIFSLMAEVKELRKLAVEQERHQKETLELKEMLEKVKVMKEKVQNLHKMK